VTTARAPDLRAEEMAAGVPFELPMRTAMYPATRGLYAVNLISGDVFERIQPITHEAIEVPDIVLVRVVPPIQALRMLTPGAQTSRTEP
jgi:hypothetical protein